jgi:hypothetical protein
MDAQIRKLKARLYDREEKIKALKRKVSALRKHEHSQKRRQPRASVPDDSRVDCEQSSNREIVPSQTELCSPLGDCLEVNDKFNACPGEGLDKPAPSLERQMNDDDRSQTIGSVLHEPLPSGDQDEIPQERLESKSLPPPQPMTLRNTLQENDEHVERLGRERDLALQRLADTIEELSLSREQIRRRDQEVSRLRGVLNASGEGALSPAMCSWRKKLVSLENELAAKRGLVASLRAQLQQAQHEYNATCKCMRLRDEEHTQQIAYLEQECRSLRGQVRTVTAQCAVLQDRIHGRSKDRHSAAVADSVNATGFWQVPPECSAQMAGLQSQVWELRDQVSELQKECTESRLARASNTSTQAELERVARINHVLLQREEKCGMIVHSALALLKAQYPSEFEVCAFIARNKYPQANELALLYATLAVYAFRERVVVTPGAQEAAQAPPQT